MMRSQAPSRITFWFWTVVFFSVGVAIAVMFALSVIDKGAPLVVALVAGAGVGGFGAWAVFFLLLHAVEFIKRTKLARFSPKRMLTSAALVALGVGIGAIAYQLVASATTRDGIAIGFSLLHVGCTLIGAGVFYPFGRPLRGALIGFALCLVWFFSI